MQTDAATAANALQITERPANPGFCYKQHLREDPNKSGSGEMVRGWQKQTHTLLYRPSDKVGNDGLVFYHPGETAEKDAAFKVVARRKDLRLVTRPERRAMYLEERRRYKRAKAKARKEAVEVT